PAAGPGRHRMVEAAWGKWGRRGCWWFPSWARNEAPSGLRRTSGRRRPGAVAQAPLHDTGGGRRRERGIAGRAMLRAFRRRGLALVQRMLHPRRRDAAFATLRELGRVERVLFVCHGNIYRSPYAEVVFRSQLPEDFRERIAALSGGFVGPGRPAPEE